ncbi:MAG: hypothetical protein WDM79_11995 [Terricaulis sp.]
MDQKALRTWGIFVGGAALAGSVAIAAINPARDAAPTIERRPAVSAPAPLPAKAETPPPVFEPAAAVTPPSANAAPVSFVVRFGDHHPLAAAQRLAAEGEIDEARRSAERALTRQRSLRGLCFDRFTVGGAEIVLKSCEPLTEREAESFRRRWSERFQSMSGIDYAEANVILTPEAR